MDKNNAETEKYVFYLMTQYLFNNHLINQEDKSNIEQEINRLYI